MAQQKRCRRRSARRRSLERGPWTNGGPPGSSRDAVSRYATSRCFSVLPPMRLGRAARSSVWIAATLERASSMRQRESSVWVQVPSTSSHRSTVHGSASSHDSVAQADAVVVGSASASGRAARATTTSARSREGAGRMPGERRRKTRAATVVGKASRAHGRSGIHARPMQRCSGPRPRVGDRPPGPALTARPAGGSACPPGSTPRGRRTCSRCARSSTRPPPSRTRRGSRRRSAPSASAPR